MTSERTADSRLEELSSEECMRLLAYGSYTGHVGFVREGRVTILPVNYLFDDDALVIRTHAGTPLSGLEGEAVAFEVDDRRPLGHSGWSVLVHGQVHVITDASTLDRLRRGPLRSWTWPHADLWLRLSIDTVTGRRVAES